MANAHLQAAEALLKYENGLDAAEANYNTNFLKAQGHALLAIARELQVANEIAEANQK